jgi:hypothetical protein
LRPFLQGETRAQAASSGTNETLVPYQDLSSLGDKTAQNKCQFASSRKHVDASGYAVTRRQSPENQAGGTQQELISEALVQGAADNIQSKDRIRRSFVSEAFPCQPQFRLVQEIFSSPNIFIAWMSESDTFEHFR